MKKILTLVAILISAAISAQNYAPSTNTLISTCSGNFYDSGGNPSGFFGQYGASQNYTVTFCPATAGSKVVLNFTTFALENNVDFMYIFDGNSTSAPVFGSYTGTTAIGLVQATPSNASGCITIRFVSNAFTQLAGWEASISCTTPCEIINSVINSSSPPIGAGGAIRTCPGQSVTFNGGGTFSSGISAGATYSWDFGNGTSGSGITGVATYTAPGVYLVNLYIVKGPCGNYNKLQQLVYVSTPPSFVGTAASPTTLCLGQTGLLTASVTPTPTSSICTPSVSGVTFLPDGNGTSYQTCIPVNCYGSTQTITSAADIANICLTIEHSFTGDLDIVIKCPNGQQTSLLNYGGIFATGGSNYLGNPIDNTTGGPGTGFTYCFSPSATTLLMNAPTVIAGTPAGTSFAAGTYSPATSMNSLIGCPLNGSWCIVVTDHQNLDDGYIFNWDINFAPGITPASQSFTPSIVSQTWTGPFITGTSGNNAAIQPTVAGTPCYTLTVVDDLGCSFSTTRCITVNPGPFAGMSNTLSVCGSAGSTNLFGLLGTSASTTGTWAGPAPALSGGNLGTFNPASYTAGTYNYTYSVPASGSCPASSAVISVTVNPNPVLSISSSTICAGNTASLTASGANSYTWNPAVTLTNPNGSAVSTNPAATTAYTVTGTIGTCTASAVTAVHVAVNPTLTVSSATICSGNTTTLTASGANTYTWSPATTFINPNGSTVSANPATTTVYTVTGASGICTASAIATVTVITTPTVSVNSQTVCSGVSTTLTANGASTYTWAPDPSLSATNGNTVVATPLSTTSYTVTGANGSCTHTAVSVVTIAAGLSISVNSATVCAGGSAVLTAGGGATYSWSPSTGLSATSGSTVSANPAATTIYTVTGYNSGCTGSNTTTLSVAPNPTVTASSATICAGNTATLTASGATNYTWTPAVTLIAPNGSTVTTGPAATTNYTVLGATGSCTASGLVSVSVLSNPTITTGSSTICAGNTATLTAAGASNYTWTPAVTFLTANGSSVTVTPATNSTYTVTGAIGTCTAFAVASVSVQNNPTLTVSSATVCAGTTATLTAAGAQTYTWIPAVTLVAPNGSTVTTSPASTTNYTVTGSVGTCTATALTSVSVAPNPTVTASSATICAGNTATLTASGANNYTWTPAVTFVAANGSTVTTGPTATTNYTVLGATGSCTASGLVSVNVISNPTVTVNSQTVCAGVSATLTATGAATYTWSPGASLSTTSGSVTLATPANTTTYTVTGANGTCTHTATSVVSIASGLSISVNSASVCAGSSTLLTAGGANTYSWSPSTGLSAATGSTVSASPGVSTVYTVTGQSNGCVGSNTSTVSMVANPTVTLSSSTVCAGTTATLTASGATGYTWTPSVNPITANGSSISTNPVSTTSYTVLGTSNSCTASAVTSVSVVNNPTLSLSSATICAGGTATLTVGGASSYTWTPAVTLVAANGSTVTTSPATTSSYTVLGSSGSCTASATGNVLVVNNPTISVSAVSATICPTSSAVLTANGASTYTWSSAATLSSPNGASVTATPAATETYTILGAVGTCTNLAFFTLHVAPSPVITTSGNATLCSTSSGTLTASGASTYTWSPATGLSSATGGTVVANPAGSQTYTVTGSSSLGCAATATLDVMVVQSPTITLSASPSTICDGSSSTLTASGATSYTWNPSSLPNPNGNSNVVSPSTSTSYTVSGSNSSTGGFCISTNAIVVTVLARVTPTISSGERICYGSHTTLYAAGGSSYSWAPAMGLSKPNAAITPAKPLATTVYTVTVSNGLCTGTGTVEIIVDPLPVVYAGVDTVINIDESLVLHGTGNVEAGFIPTDGIPLVCNFCMDVTVSPKQTTCYELRGTNAFGCTASDVVCVRVTKNWDVYIPNAFTPNSDNLNDLFKPEGYGIAEMNITIFDRWGTELFRSDENTPGWNGQYKGATCKQDVYVYRAEIKALSGETIFKVGHVTLMPKK